MALSDSEDENDDEDISDADRFKALQEATFRQRAEGDQDDSSDDEDESDQGEVNSRQTFPHSIHSPKCPC